jgi:plastocyanin
VKLAPRAVVPVLLLAGITLAGCSSSSGGSTTAAQPSGAAPRSSAPAPAAAGTALTIAGFNYSPKPLTVAPGATVSVTNKDGAEHTATSDTSGAFDSSDVAQGQVITFKAPTRPGTYTFHCAYHPNMHGTLIVK